MKKFIRSLFNREYVASKAAKVVTSSLAHPVSSLRNQMLADSEVDVNFADFVSDLAYKL